MKRTLFRSLIYFTVWSLSNILCATEFANKFEELEATWITISNKMASTPIESVKKLADDGDSNAQYYYGWALQKGNRVEPNLNEAVVYLRKSADQGCSLAQNRVAWLYGGGNDFAPNIEESLKYFHLAISNGNPSASFCLGVMYRDGNGVPENSEEARKLFEQSANLGDLRGAESLLWMYSHGINAKVNCELATFWVKKIVNIETAQGKCRIADTLQDVAQAEEREYFKDPNHFTIGKPSKRQYEVSTNFLEAARWYKMSADQGCAHAQYLLGEMYHFGMLGDSQRSNGVAWFLKAASNGDQKAQVEIANLGGVYEDKQSHKQVNPVEALKTAAENGDLEAQFHLAFRYHLGDGVAKNPSEAFKYMEMAAKHDVSPVTMTIDAHYYLGLMYETGEGIEKNMTNAYKLYLEAAVGGNKPDPLVRAGQMYENGEGVEQDYNTAIQYYVDGMQFGCFPTENDTPRCIGVEKLLNLYYKGFGTEEQRKNATKIIGDIEGGQVSTPKSQLLMGKIYRDGKLLAQDLSKAYSYIKLAADQDFGDSNSLLQQMESTITPDQKSDAMKIYLSLKKKNSEWVNNYNMMADYRRTQVW